jgi:Flp pilus assembly pilin Flp
MRLRIRPPKSRRGQTMVEYIIIVAVIAIGGLVLFGIFGDTLKKKMSGVISSLDEDKGSEAQSAADENSAEQLKSLDATGI